jgi:putative ABC transport system permease protein
VIAATTSLAFSALLRNKMRSTLTMLGIVIGVAAVILMQSMGRGATAYVGEMISGLGSNMLIVVPGTAKTMGTVAQGIPLFTMADIEAIRRQAPDIAEITAAAQRPLRVVVGATNRSVSSGGVMPEYFSIRGWGASSGRVISTDDVRSAALVCLIGQTVSDTFFGGQSPIGKDLRVHDLSCRVIGVLEAKGASAFGMDQDDVVFMPFTTFSRRIIGNDRVAVIMMSAISDQRIDDLKREVTEILRRRRHIPAGEDDDFAVRDPREIQALLQSVTGILTTLLAAVAAVSLVVGGIGVMNIMLVSVTERTREIGVRLALGARANDILTQFLVEAVALSATGGVIGVGFGALVAWGAARVISIPFVVPGIAAPIAFAVSVLVGVAFGVFPARKAARLNPLAALRYE